MATRSLTRKVVRYCDAGPAGAPTAEGGSWVFTRRPPEGMGRARQPALFQRSAPAPGKGRVGFSGQRLVLSPEGAAGNSPGRQPRGGTRNHHSLSPNGATPRGRVAPLGLGRIPHARAPGV